MTEFRPKLVMLVDDSDTDNFINKRVIELSKFTDEILIKNSGRSALEYLADNAENAEKLPDIIFLDINMPIVDGFVFLYEFEEFSDQLKSHCRVIILSSSNSKKDIDRIVDNTNVFDFYTKPLSLDTVANLKTNKSLIQNYNKPSGGH